MLCRRTPGLSGRDIKRPNDDDPWGRGLRTKRMIDGRYVVFERTDNMRKAGVRRWRWPGIRLPPDLPVACRCEKLAGAESCTETSGERAARG